MTAREQTRYIMSPYVWTHVCLRVCPGLRVCVCVVFHIPARCLTSVSGLSVWHVSVSGSNLWPLFFFPRQKLPPPRQKKKSLKCCLFMKKINLLCDSRWQKSLNLSCSVLCSPDEKITADGTDGRGCSSLFPPQLQDTKALSLVTRLADRLHTTRHGPCTVEVSSVPPPLAALPLPLLRGR